MLKLNHVSLELGKKEILKDISISIPDGKICIFVGENGSGKTSLLQGLLDYEKNKYTGTISIDEIDIKEMKSKDLAKKVAFNFQIKPYSDAYVIDMLELARAPYHKISIGIDDEERRIIDEAISLCGIEEYVYRKMNTLSGGERQMVYLAMSIIQSSPYMIFDEPDTYLDISNKRKTMEIIQELKEKGHTILMSLHNLEDAFQYGDILYVIKDGKLVGQINKEEFSEEKIIEEVFSVRKQELLMDGVKYYIFR